MSSYVAEFYRRRKRGIAVSLSVAGGLYLLVQYAKSKFEDAQQRMLDERAAEDNIRRRFRQTQEDCAFAVQALLPNIVEDLIKEMNVEDLTAALQTLSRPSVSLSDSTSTLDASQPSLASSVNASGVLVEHESASPAAPPEPQRSKAEIWSDIKLLSLSRSITALYLVGLLTVQSHVQLNILGRKSYLGSLADAAQREAEREQLDAIARMASGTEALFGSADDPARLRANGVSADTEMKYLTFSWWLLHKSWKRLAERVQEAVAQVFSKMQLKAALTPNELARLLYKVRLTLEGTSTSPCKFTHELFPVSERDQVYVLQQGGVPEANQFINPELKGLVDETLDFFDSPDCAIVARACFEQLFKVFITSLSPCFKDSAPPSAQSESTFQHPLNKIAEVEERTSRLVNLLPAATRETRTILAGLPNIYVESLQDVKELKELSAIIFAPSGSTAPL